jgi:predicted nucleotidyltransferase
MEQKLVNYILEKYKPLALLLHGSRANGNSREHSDWDFAIIVNDKITTDREIIDNQNIEIRVLVLPLPELTRENSSPWLVLRAGNIKVLFDTNNIAENIISQVTEYYNTPLVFSNSEIAGHGAWFKSQVDGMIDYQNEQEAFFRKLSELYPRTIMYWFHFKRRRYMPQVYQSLPIIKQEDPEYFKLIEILAGNFSNIEKIKTAEIIFSKIFV